MKKKALSIILSVAMLTTPSALVNVSAEEIGFTDGFEAGQTDYSDEGTDSLGEERAYPDEETAVSGEGALLQREMMRMRCQIPVKKCCHLLLEMKWTKVRKMKKILVTEQ